MTRQSMHGPRVVARAPMRTVRPADLGQVYAQPRVRVRDLEARGVLHRLAHGYYCAVPLEFDAGSWRPSLEAAAAGIATAVFGDRVPVLMGKSAARVHRALPRAGAQAWVAVPRAHRPVQLVDRDAVVRFVRRDVAALDATLVSTDLGQTLATTVEQTVLDLARSDPRLVDLDTQEAIGALLPVCDQQVLGRLAGQQRMRATLRRLEAVRP